MMEKEDIIKDKSMDFAIRVVNLCKYLKKEKQEYEISKQLVRLGTAIAQKECNITRSIKTAESHIPS